MFLRGLCTLGTSNAARSTPAFIGQKRLASTKKTTTYQNSRDRDLLLKQRNFKKLTPAVYIERKEVETHDGFRIVEDLIDHKSKPHELHLIKKVTSIFGEPYWVKNALAQLGLSSNKWREWETVYSVQPNTKRVNDLIWLCKHLVKVTPIKFKNGHPTENDIQNSRLNLETGEFEIIKPLEVLKADGGRLDCYQVNNVLVTEEMRPGDSFPITKKDLHRDFHRRYELKRLNEEYFPTKYEYTLDQDKPGVIRLPGKASTNVTEDECEETI